MLIDGLVERLTGGKLKMDKNGLTASRGRVHVGLLAELAEHPYIVRKPPKSTGRETFGADFIDFLIEEGKKLRMKPEDLVATATSFTAASIRINCEKFILPHGKIDEVIAGGGGVRNPVLMAMLKKAFAPVPILRFEEIGINSKAVEAMAFALFAYDTIHGIPNNVPSATGARRAVVLGKIVPGLNFKKLIG